MRSFRGLCDAILVEYNYQTWVKTWRFSRDTSRQSYAELNRKLIKGYEKHYGDYEYEKQSTLEQAYNQIIKA